MRVCCGREAGMQVSRLSEIGARMPISWRLCNAGGLFSQAMVDEHARAVAGAGLRRRLGGGFSPIPAQRDAFYAEGWPASAPRITMTPPGDSSRRAVVLAPRTC